MRSAARLHGWAQKRVPVIPDITYPRTRHIAPAERRHVVPHWSDLPDHDVVDGVTSVRRTLIDCMRMLPLDESLPIVESALREGDVSEAGLRRIAEDMRGRGRARARGVADLASRRTANAYESVLHALASTVPGLNVQPQLALGVGRGRQQFPDFADPELGIILEAESFEWHGDTAALSRDCQRYNDFANRGWLVIRFSWRQVMFEQAYVLAVLARAVQLARQRHANVARCAVPRLPAVQRLRQSGVAGDPVQLAAGDVRAGLRARGAGPGCSAGAPTACECRLRVTGTSRGRLQRHSQGQGQGQAQGGGDGGGGPTGQPKRPEM